MRAMPKLAAAAAVSVLVVEVMGACTSSTEPSPARRVPDPPITTSPSPAPQTSCSESPTDTIQLGGEGEVLAGNSSPVRATVHTGTVIRVTARLGERPLSFPASTSSALLTLCSSHHRWTYTTYFRASHPGTARITSNTSTCGQCAQLGFETDVVVRDR